MNHSRNLVRIKAVYNALGHLKDQVVFVGGATVAFYVDRMAEEVRPTDDVDVLVEIWTYKEYAALEEQLRKMGFANDTSSGVICRYKIDGIIVDIMPTGENVLGFKNKWYPEGYKNSIVIDIDGQYSIRIFSLPYFIASKLDAFIDRGENNGPTSRDFEDIIYVLEYSRSVWDQLNNAPADVKLYLQENFSALLANPYFFEWVDGHVSYGSPPATYYIIRELEAFAKGK
jgi:predicted nucleotidyltransferase